MAVLIVIFLVTIIAHGVTPNLECWGCWGSEYNGTHPCNDEKNFKVLKCKKNEIMCIDLVYKEEKSYMAKECMSEEYWKKFKPIVEDREKGIWKICNTTKCNDRKWNDYLTDEERATPALQCWACKETEDKKKTKPCNDPNNFQIKTCQRYEEMCIDLVFEKHKYMSKDCMSKEYWKDKMKSYVEDEIEEMYEICNTTKCNTKKWEDYFPVTAKNNVQNKTPAPVGVKVPLKKCRKLG